MGNCNFIVASLLKYAQLWWKQKYNSRNEMFRKSILFILIKCYKVKKKWKYIRERFLIYKLPILETLKNGPTAVWHGGMPVHKKDATHKYEHSTEVRTSRQISCNL